MLNWKATKSGLPFTTPTLLWVTEPHLYFGVVTVGFTLTLSPIFIWEGELCGGNPGKNKQHMLKDWEKTCCRDFPSTTRFLLQHIRITPAHQVTRCGCIGPSTFLLSAASHTARSGHEVRLCPALSLSRHLHHTLPRTFCNTLPSSPPEEKSPIHQTAVATHQSSFRTSSKGRWSYLNVLSHVYSIIIVALKIWSLLKRLAFSHHCSWRLMSHTKG